MSEKLINLLGKGNMDTDDVIDSNDINLIDEYEHEEHNSDNRFNEYDINEDEGTVTYVVTEDYEDTDNDNDNAFVVEYVNSANGNDDVDSNDEDLYNCNVCGMNFKSINDHVAQYHSDQDVILDVADNDSPQVKKEPSEYLDDDDDRDTLNDFPSDGEMGDYIIDETATPITAKSDTKKKTVIRSQSLSKDKTNETNATPESYSCNRCNQIFDTLRALSSHLLNAHEKEVTGGSQRQRTTKIVRKIVKPKMKTVKEPTSLIDKNSEYICEICNTVFQSSKSLKLHARMHNPIKMKTLEEAAEHELDTIPMNNEAYREKFFCGICDKMYDKTFEEIHVQMHNGEEKFNCTICNKLFPNEASISMHMNAHQETRVIKTKAELNNIKLPYACQYCGKEFARPHEKVKHERVHTGEKPYECEICGKCFRVSYCLTIHMRTHTDARPYVCPHCNKRFKAQSVYNHHLLTHSDVRNYKCPYCPKTFKTSVQLSGHKNSHTKPFACTECNRPFGSLYAVRAHMESHKRPNHNLKHCCSICGARYARRFALNDHMKEQHDGAQADAIEFVEVKQTNSTRKTQPKRNRNVKNDKQVSDEFEITKEDFISIEDERELEAASESILQDTVEQEVTISEIDHFENEEEVVDIDWLK